MHACLCVCVCVHVVYDEVSFHMINVEIQLLLLSLSVYPGESDVKRLLLMIKSNDHREKWLGRLSQIAITRDSGQNTSPT